MFSLSHTLIFFFTNGQFWPNGHFLKTNLYIFYLKKFIIIKPFLRASDVPVMTICESHSHWLVNDWENDLTLSLYIDNKPVQRIPKHGTRSLSLTADEFLWNTRAIAKTWLRWLWDKNFHIIQFWRAILAIPQPLLIGRILEPSGRGTKLF